MTILRKITAFGALAALLLLAACGGGGDAGAPLTPAPDVVLTAPANFSSGLAGTVALAATATGAAGVSGVEFQVDGVKLGATVATAPYGASLDTTQYASGQHVIRARALGATGTPSAWASATVSFGGTRTQPAGFTRNEAWVSSLGNATALAQATDGRWFIATQGGALRVVKAGALLATPFVQLTVDSAGERGLLSVALHPDFATNHYIYLYYTTLEGGTHNRVSRFTANGDVALVGSEVKLIDLPALSTATNHNGGALHFGSDGKLYIGVGDNANGAQAQDRTSLFGKLLRVNDDGSVPTDSPFYASNAGLSRAVWAYGLRNPFTFAVEPGTGRIHINDVGESTWEEIDLGTAGANYGWPGSEGPDGVGAGVTAPLFAYKHAATSPPGSGPGGFFTGIAIAGGSFYPSSGPFPAAYQGSYFFADFGSGFVARFDAVNSAAYAFGSVSGSPVDMRVGIDGALYVLTRDSVVRFSAP
jgi:glucose/arabinose dehydrogenase